MSTSNYCHFIFDKEAKNKERKYTGQPIASSRNGAGETVYTQRRIKLNSYLSLA